MIDIVGGDGEGVSVNGVLSGARTGTSKFTAYISPYLVVNNGGNYSKHIYMGSQRIASKLSNSGIFSSSPVNTTDLQTRLALQTTKIKERFDSLGVIYKGTAQTGGLLSGIPVTTASSYFYHSDHLGSSSLITDASGALVQHLEYIPFGEVFIDERPTASSWSTPYKFNAKELDEETGLYYYGARYMDPRTSVWISVDPLAEEYMNVSSYVYCLENPIIFIDPDGRGAKITLYAAGVHRDSYGKITERHENLFKSEANRDVKWSNATISLAAHSGATLLEILRAQTISDGDIEYLSIYSHAGTMGIILDNGQYGLEVIGHPGTANWTNSLGEAYTSTDISSIYNDPNIKFASNALVVFGGCNAGRTVSSDGNNTPVYSIAKDFTEKTGVPTIAAYGYTSPSGKDGNRKADYEYRLFYKNKSDGVQFISLGKELNKEAINKAKDFINNLNKE
ncbi:MAG: hypothetical protein PHS84_02395 [Paludibacter sp.]|nr:hypothetical protein [Paludibacter sp.]